MDRITMLSLSPTARRLTSRKTFKSVASLSDFELILNTDKERRKKEGEKEKERNFSPRSSAPKLPAAEARAALMLNDSEQKSRL